MTINTEPVVVAKISTPGDMIASIPISLGFRPSESLVVTTLHGPRKRQGLTLRCNLPDSDDAEQLASYVVESVVKQEPVGVVIVCFCDSPDCVVDSDSYLPHHGLVNNLVERLSEENIGYVAALLARNGAWWHYGVGADLQSAVGTPLPTTPSSEITALAARHALEGKAVAASREELAATVAGPASVQGAVMENACETEAAVLAEEISADGETGAAVRTLRLAIEAFDAHRAGAEPSYDTTARILAGLRIKCARDALMTWGLDDNVGEFVGFLITLARQAPDSYAAPICTILAAVAYQNYNCITAIVSVERALRCEPSYYLAQLLDTMFQGQVPPDEFRESLYATRAPLQELGLPVACPDQPPIPTSRPPDIPSAEERGKATG
jgi:hypothetical protein